MRSVLIRCFCQWVGEEAEGEYSDSGDCDCERERECIIEWWGRGGKNSLEWICAGGGGGKKSVEWISCRCFFVWLFLLFVFTSTMLSMR